jgi:hypothetical protein
MRRICRSICFLALLASSALVASSAGAVIIPLSTQQTVFFEQARTRLLGVGRQDFSLRGTLTATGEIDTETLEIRNFQVSFDVVPSQVTTLHTGDFNVVNTVSTVIDPPGFEPPYTVITKTVIGTISASLTTHFDVTLDDSGLSSIPDVLHIDPFTLRAGNFSVGSVTLDVTTGISASRDGTVVSEHSLEPLHSVTELRLAVACFQVPSPRCSVGIGGTRDRALSYDRVDLELADFGVFPPSQGTTTPLGIFAEHTFVPEPGTGLLVMAGMLGLAARRRRFAV